MQSITDALVQRLRRDRSSPQRSRARSALRRLECLEDRTAPAVFANGTSISTIFNGGAAAWGDFNEDGTADFVSTNFGLSAGGALGGSNVSVFIGNNSGTFNTPYTVNVVTGSNRSPSYVVVTDVDNDDNQDLVVSIYNDNNVEGGSLAGFVSILKGNGAGGFTLTQSFNSGGGGAAWVAVGKFDNNPGVDIAVANIGYLDQQGDTVAGNNVGIFVNNGSGTFTGTTAITNGLNFVPDAVSAVDLNADGFDDLAITSGQSGFDGAEVNGSLFVFLNNQSAQFTTQAPGLSDTSGKLPYGLAVGDLNGDSFADVVIANTGGNDPNSGSGQGNIGVALGAGNGNFGTVSTFATGSFIFAVQIADLDGDGDNDVAGLDYGPSGASKLHVLLSGGGSNPNFSPESSSPYTNLGVSDAQFFILRDFNNDAKPDAVIVGVSNAGIMLNTSTPASSPPTITTGAPPAAGTTGTAYSFDVNATGAPAPTFSIVSGSLPTGLTINATTGVISGTPTVVGGFTFSIRATNSAGTDTDGPYTITVGTAPTITTGTPPAAGTTGTAYSFDVDATGSPAPTFSIVSGSLPTGVSIDATTGVISGTPTTAGGFTFSIRATNSAGTDTDGPYTITVSATGTAPTITTGAPPSAGTTGTAYSFDVDATGSPAPTFSIVSGSLPTGLTIDATTGVISGTPTAPGGFTFSIRADNTAGTDTDGPYTITVSTAPTITTGVPPAAGTTGTAYSFDVDATGTAPITFSIVSGSLPTGLSIDATTGVISGTPTVAGGFTFSIRATNAAGTDTDGPYTVTVGTAPTITTGAPPAAGTTGTAYSFDVDATGAPAPTFSIVSGALPTGLTIDATTGVISGTPTVAGGFTFSLRATNAAGTDTDGPYTITVSAAPTITTGAPPAAGTTGTAYSFDVDATGTAPITFSIVSGALPTGLSLDAATGIISGTPTAAGGFTFSIRATNVAGTDTDGPYTVTVGTAPTITTGAPPSAGTTGTAYSFDVDATGSPAPTFSIAGGSLPPGLSIDAATGVISGTPTAAGSSAFTVRAANAAGFDDEPYFITVSTAPTITTGAPPAAGTTGTAYSFDVDATGTAPITFSIVSGSLPTGLSLDATTGVISGTPTAAGGFTFSIRATNVAGTDTDGPYTITVGTAPTITTGAPPSAGTTGTAYSFDVDATGAPAPTFSVVSGSLPTGLSLDATTGVISGTPTVDGAFTFSIRTDNVAGTDTDGPYTITVSTAPAITTGTPPSIATTGTVYSFDVDATGTAPITFSILDGALPAGLSLDAATGVLSGTPTTIGSFDFTVRAANSAGFDDEPYFILVTPPPVGAVAPSITSAPPTATATAGTPYGFDVDATGTPVPTYSAVGLPPGLTIDAATGVVSGTPTTAGTFSGVLTATNTAGSADQAFSLTVVAAVDPGTKVVALSGPADGTVRVFSFDAGGRSTPGGGAYYAGPSTVSLGISGLVRAAAADVNGDGMADVVMVAGPGGGDFLRVVSGRDGSTLVGEFHPYAGEDFTSIGLFVAAGDLDGDDNAEVVVSPDQGGGARVQIFSLQGGTLVRRANFFGIDDPAFRGGGRIALGDVNGDGRKELVVAAGFTGGPRVAVYDGAGLLAGSGTPPKLINDFFAFEQTLRNGCFVTVGDLTGDAKAELIFGGGPGGGPRVLGLDAATALSAGTAAAINSPTVNFFAFDDGQRGGVRLAVKDVDGDNRLDLIVGTGEGTPSGVKTYLGKSLSTTPPVQEAFDPFGSAVLFNGVFVG